MQFILFLLLLFTIGCVLYGISAGVQGIQRGAARLAQYSDPKNKNTQKEPNHEARAETKKLNSTQRCLSILEELRELHQQGGLSQEDFNNLQKHLISSFSLISLNFADSSAINSAFNALNFSGLFSQSVATPNESISNSVYTV